MTEPDVIPEDALEERFLAATGPGGQNVNKVATAVQIRLDVFALRLLPSVYARLKTITHRHARRCCTVIPFLPPSIFALRQ